jgi:hypothetical protein
VRLEADRQVVSRPGEEVALSIVLRNELRRDVLAVTVSGTSDTPRLFLSRPGGSGLEPLQIGVWAFFGFPQYVVPAGEEIRILIAEYPFKEAHPDLPPGHYVVTGWMQLLTYFPGEEPATFMGQDFPEVRFENAVPIEVR